MREKEKLKFVIQVDTMCHRIPRFISKAGWARGQAPKAGALILRWLRLRPQCDPAAQA
jgi:hypothetical protein